MGLTLAGFVIALGFATAGLVCSLDQLMRGRSAMLVPSTATYTGIAGAFLFCMFSGPYIVLERGLAHWRNGTAPASLFTLCLAISLLWSFCLGVLVAQFLIGIGVLGG